MKKQGFIIVFLMILSASAAFSLVGSGTAQDPYNISSCPDLNRTRDYLYPTTGIYFQLTNDINCDDTRNWNGSEGWMPIGSSLSSFVSTIYGNDHNIINITINRPANTEYTGLFGNVGVGVGGYANIYGINLVNVNITGNDGVGSLAGVLDGANIYNCSSTGRVSGNRYVGGLMGAAPNHVLIYNCYSRADVFGNISWIGGFIGEINNALVITHSYSTGNVTGSATDINGFLGIKHGGGCINSYWDTETSGQPGDPCAAGLTTAQMRNMTIFTNAGWDFANVWRISPAANDGYPYLKWQRFRTKYAAFSGSTDFLAAANLNNVTSAVLASSQGVIAWVNGINVNGADFDSNAKIEANLISLNMSKFDQGLNSSATVSMNIGACQAYTLYYSPNYHNTQASLLADPQKEDCITGGQCTNVQCNNGIVTFNVGHFDTYGSNGGVPEFSAITLMLALVIVVCGFVAIRKRDI